MGDNELMTGFSTTTARFGYAMSANRVEVRRDDIADLVTGEPCGIFVERLADGDQSQSLAADYPSDGSGPGDGIVMDELHAFIIDIKPSLSDIDMQGVYFYRCQTIKGNKRG